MIISIKNQQQLNLNGIEILGNRGILKIELSPRSPFVVKQISWNNSHLKFWSSN